MTSLVVPRPIAWVSTADRDHVPNLAPYSFFTIACVRPLVVAISIADRRTGPKDTYENIRHHGEFVVNLVPQRLAEAMNITSGEYPPGVNEFELAGVTPVPSVKVSVPRVKESPASFECRWLQSISLGWPTTHFTLGEVVWIHVDDELVDDQERPVASTERLNPVARLGGPYYGHVSDYFRMARPPAQPNPELPRKASDGAGDKA